MDRRHRLLARLPLLAGALAIVALVGVAIWLIAGSLGDKDDKPERKVQTVTVLRPPPPPPPPEEQPPPPEEKIEEPLPQDEPEPAPADEAAPSEQLGLDADGSAGSDGFGLLARKGGRDITGAGGAVFAWYTTRLRDAVQSKLADDERVRTKRFSASVRVWIEPDGRVRDVRLASSTGSGELDSAIQAALARLPAMAEPPPVEMPQPVTLRIVSRS